MTLHPQSQNTKRIYATQSYTNAIHHGCMPVTYTTTPACSGSVKVISDKNQGRINKASLNNIEGEKTLKWPTWEKSDS